MNQSNKIIGIDLGTTNSVLAVIQDGVPVLLPVNGDRLLPSVVGIAPNGDVLVGTSARNQWVVAPDRTVRSIKRKMGKAETVGMAGKTYTPQEISAFILTEHPGSGPGRAGRRHPAGGHHRASLLQRDAAPGDAGGRGDRRADRRAHHQRADRLGAGLWLWAGRTIST